MSKKEQTHTRHTKHILVALCATHILTFLWLATLQISISRSDLGSERNTRQLMNMATELRFCLDNHVIPCDDVSINQWNEDNPANKFTIQRDNR